MIQALTNMRMMTKTRKKKISLRPITKGHRYQRVMGNLRASNRKSQEAIIITQGQGKGRGAQGEATETTGLTTTSKALTTGAITKDKVCKIALTLT